MKLTFPPRRLLLPLVPIYRLALVFREFRLRVGLEPVRRLRFPVVSIGNLSTGGSGKTPLTIALAKALAARGLRVDVLSRGYGRQSRLAARVNPDGTAVEFGDEPLLIAREAGVPVYVAPRRYDAGLLAEAEASLADKGSGLRGSGLVGSGLVGSGLVGSGLVGSKLVGSGLVGRDFSPGIQPPKSSGALQAEEELNSKSALYQGTTLVVPQMPQDKRRALAPAVSVHLLDDGFQHRQLARDVEILLLDRRDWQDTLLPAGNLREPLRALHRASVIAIPADDPELEAELKAWGWQGPLWRLHRRMEIPAVEGPLAAFCGIARPEQFFAGLEAAGLRLTARIAFPDHFTHTRAVLEELLTKARAAGATALITTEKDHVRLGKLASTFPRSVPLTTARLTVDIAEQDGAIDWLVDRVAQSSEQSIFQPSLEKVRE